MRARILLGLTAALAAMTVNYAQASIEGYAHLTITGFGLYIDTDPTLAGGAQGAPITNGVHVTVVSSSTSSGASANVGSIAGGPVSTSNFSINSSAGANTSQAYEGAPVAPAENDFSNYDGSGNGNLPFARGDTRGSGVIIAGLPEAQGAMSELVSEVQLRESPSISDNGQASSNGNATASFMVTPLMPLDIYGVFTGMRELVADLTPFPPGVLASADTSVTFSVRDALTNALIFGWSPDGLAGGVSGSGMVAEFLDPFDINGSISGFPGLTASVSEGPGVFAAGFHLEAGRPYSFTLDFQTQASATTVGVVPEAATIVVWSVLTLVGGVVARRRMKLA